jgi:hypothetical protein
MELRHLDITNTPIEFQTYALQNPTVRRILSNFKFYNIMVYREQYKANAKVFLSYPKANVYWYLEFEKVLLTDDKLLYKDVWEIILRTLKHEIYLEYTDFQENLEQITDLQIHEYMMKYNLRDYQAQNLLQLNKRLMYNSTINGQAALILSEQRTGKTRIAIANVFENLEPSATIVIICPKNAIMGWKSELEEISEHAFGSKDAIDIKLVTKLSMVKNATLNQDLPLYSFRIMTYDLFKKSTDTQIQTLFNIGKSTSYQLIADEVHRLRNFKTLQSNALFRIKNLFEKKKVRLNILGLTGTPAIKDSYDVFGILSLINYSKFLLYPTYLAFEEFKEYFYNCENTPYGKVALSLRKENELQYLIHMHSIQTKQKDLGLFKNYKKQYRKIELQMTPTQAHIYKEVDEFMEYEDKIDAQNGLVKLLRLQQICVDPSILVEDYNEGSPKLNWIVDFSRRNFGQQFIVMSKKVTVLNKLSELLAKLDIKFGLLTGGSSLEMQQDIKNKFATSQIQLLLMQSDVGKEAHTLPAAKATIFIDRDFAQGYNEQAEARMTPVDGSDATKYVIDLVMKDSVEEHIYSTLVIRKKSIKSINDLNP